MARVPSRGTLTVMVSSWTDICLSYLQMRNLNLGDEVNGLSKDEVLLLT